jgi:hypothetical protein
MMPLLADLMGAERLLQSLSSRVLQNAVGVVGEALEKRLIVRR